MKINKDLQLFIQKETLEMMQAEERDLPINGSTMMLIIEKKNIKDLNKVSIGDTKFVPVTLESLDKPEDLKFCGIKDCRNIINKAEDSCGALHYIKVKVEIDKIEYDKEQ